jgi:hypothetical protein
MPVGDKLLMVPMSNHEVNMGMMEDSVHHHHHQITGIIVDHHCATGTVVSVTNNHHCATGTIVSMTNHRATGLIIIVTLVAVTVISRPEDVVSVIIVETGMLTKDSSVCHGTDAEWMQ